MYTFKQLRTEIAVNKLTQKELSEITGIPKRTIEDYEGERMNFRTAAFNKICKIADAMGLPLESFR